MSFEETLKEIVREVIREELKALSSDYGLLTAEEVARDLGYTDVRSVYRLKREKKLKATVLGDNSLRFKKSEVRRFIEQQTR